MKRIQNKHESHMLTYAIANEGSLVHVDTVDQDTLPELQKMVRSEFDNCMKQINQGLKRYTR